MASDTFHAYTFDAEGNITAVDGGSTAQYVYNAQNQRVRAVVGSAATEYVFNAAGLRVSEWNGTTRAQLKGKYYWGAMPVAYYAGGATHFEHQDWLGTERMRTTYNGGVEGSYISLPFGDGQVTSGSDTDANHYAQLDHDTESDTDHAQFRQYSNAHGRWLAPDPYSGSYDASNPQSMNRYVYALNSPLAAVDPSGLICYGDARDLLPFSGCAVQKTNTGAGGGSYSPSGYVAVSGGNGTTIFTASDWQFIKDSPGNNGITVNPDGTISAAGNNNAGWWVQFTTFGLVIGQSNNVGKGGSTGGGDGGGGGGSPYNGPNYTLHDVCVASAVLHTGLGTALDVIGIIPGLNDVVALTTGLGSASMAVFGNGFGDESTFADFALSGAGLGLTWVNTLKTIGGTAGKAVPVAGNILSGYSTYRDIKGMNAYYNDCMAGKN